MRNGRPVNWQGNAWQVVMDDDSDPLIRHGKCLTCPQSRTKGGRITQKEIEIAPGKQEGFNSSILCSYVV